MSVAVGPLLSETNGDGVAHRLREKVEAPTSRAWGVKGRLLVAALSLIVAWGIFAWIHQLRDGLAVTGLNNRVSWGLYITNFVFFIGISHAGTLISAILRLTKAEWRRPITRMAEVITVLVLVFGASSVDHRPGPARPAAERPPSSPPALAAPLGRALDQHLHLRQHHLPLPPARSRTSPSLRDSRASDGSAVGSTARCRSAGPARRAEGAGSNKAIGVMAIVVIPIAISVHTVVSWIFAMTLRAVWHSTIFGPYFVVGAIFSGIAAIIIAMAIFRRAYHLEEFITETHFRHLASLLLVLGLVYTYFTASEYITVGYKLRVGEGALLSALLVGRYAPLFWTFAIGGTLIPILLLAFRKTRTIPGIVTAAILVTIGMWLKRFVIVVPSMSAPLMPWEWGSYHPTWVEWSITAAAFAGFALVFVLLARFFPVISMWEVEEGSGVRPDRIHGPRSSMAGDGHGNGHGVAVGEPALLLEGIQAETSSIGDAG